MAEVDPAVQSVIRRERYRKIKRYPLRHGQAAAAPYSPKRAVQEGDDAHEKYLVEPDHERRRVLLVVRR